MIPFVCSYDQGELFLDERGYTCSICKKIYPVMSGIPDFSTRKFYWGEISEVDMDTLLSIIRDSGYEEGMRHLARQHANRIRFVLDPMRADWQWACDIRPGMNILDLGCGWGSHAFPLAARGATVYAVDATVQRVEFVKERARYENVNNVIPFVGDVLSLPFQVNAFDVIVCNGVLEWVGLNERFPRVTDAQDYFLNYMRSLLKPSGVLYIGIENRIALTYFRAGVDHSGYRYTSLMPRRIAHWYTMLRCGKPYRTYTYTFAGYRKLFRRASLIIRDAYIPFPGYNNPAYLVPYNNLKLLRYFFLTRRTFKKMPFLLQEILLSKLMLIVLRYFSFSFTFFLKKND